MTCDSNQRNEDRTHVIEELDKTDDAVTDITPTPEAFHIDSARTANWLVRKILEHRRYRERVRGWADAEIRTSEREEQHMLQRFGGHLEAWMRRALEEQGGRRRSISLPAGSVGLRAEPPRLVVTDDQAVLMWCRRYLVEAVQIRIEAVGDDAIQLEQWASNHCHESRHWLVVGKSTLNTYFAETGELPNGTTVTPQHDILVVK